MPSSGEASPSDVYEIMCLKLVDQHILFPPKLHHSSHGRRVSSAKQGASHSSSNLKTRHSSVKLELKKSFSVLF